MEILKISVRMKTPPVVNLGLYVLLFLATLPFCLNAQSYDELTHLEGSGLNTYYSGGAAEQATAMAETINNVIAFYKPLIDFEATATLLVLSQDDWGKFTKMPVYGMPHYTSGQTLVVASEDNDLLKSFIPPVDLLPTELAGQIIKTYADDNGQLTMRAFFDLLVIHELGHAYHFQAN